VEYTTRDSNKVSCTKVKHALTERGSESLQNARREGGNWVVNQGRTMGTIYCFNIWWYVHR